ncbi:Methylthioribose-1-phosphate isomerase [uncultured delta proteobacterium]|uniref:Methylthioribose-1-phosphate isomerase n=1 Tax=uncultured delta proteobacterium TaxID=34034 RepID=A0A212KEH9_9DELT|nr:Methylthioribose-1-phosphate isomerase [uncultured delta proteobacterium]
MLRHGRRKIRGIHSMDTHIRYDAAAKQLLLLDQKALPLAEQTVACATSDEVAACIKDLTVRGAPAIGVAAAWGALLAAEEAARLPESKDWRDFVDAALARLENARPTAVNLAWAVSRMRRVMENASPGTAGDLAALWRAEAAAMQAEDVAANRAMGAYGAELFQDGDTVLTHCNAGALATAGFGTALGVIRAAIAQGKTISVIADETRPVLQGARLTAYELAKDGIPVKVACDNAAGLLMRKGLVDRVVVGADRIAANGDTANKIGTYSVAVLAKEHGVPFYVAAPFSTIDPATPDGDAIPIEERGTGEVACLGGARVMPEGVEAYNFAFDVTPARFITGIITEKGVLFPPYTESIARFARNSNREQEL